MKAIGGYFGLELSKNIEFHDKAIKLNTGRNALQYILLAKRYTKVYLPFYACSALLHPLKTLNIDYEFYRINENFEPVFDFAKVEDTEAFLYINYFGLKSSFLFSLKNLVKNIIIDNVQAFFDLPIPKIDTFYSPRKFFGVPDGAYLYTNKNITQEIEIDVSYQRFEHLLKRLDTEAESGYPYFLQNEKSLSNSPLLKMSNLTSRILQGIDYSDVALKRRANFIYLHQHLKIKNALSLDLAENNVPLVYPFLPDNLNLRTKLTEKKIYTPVYWSDVLSYTSNTSIEYKYAERIVHLPIDQRYGLKELDKILEVIG